MAYPRTVPTDDWWAPLTAARVVRLTGPSADLVALSLEPLPDSAPAVVTCRPGPAPSLAVQVNGFLDELERIAVDLFPRWLPGAADITGPQGAGRAAVRSLAFDLAARSHHFGPFLAALAERSLTGGPMDDGQFAAEIRAAELARVIAAVYRRDTAALLVEVPDGLTASDERTLASSVEWIAHHGGFAVWLTGARLWAVDRIDTAAIQLPRHLVDLAVEEHGEAERRPAGSMSYPAPSGAPHPGSPAELALEAALAVCPWAAGRAWNQTYRSHLLADTFRLDLLWAAERLIVEIDGPDHRGAAKYATDRRRDVQLILDGYVVARFTNAHVRDDVATVTSQLERLVRSRRPEKLENHQHG